MSGKIQNWNSRNLKIGIITSIGVTSSATYHTWLGISDIAKKHNVNLMTYSGAPINLEKDFNIQQNIIYKLINKDQLGGLIIWATIFNCEKSSKEIIEFIKTLKPLPMILVGETDYIPNIPSVVPAERNNMHMMLKHLIQDHNMTKIGFFKGKEDYKLARDRFRFYKEILNEYNIPFDEKLIFSCNPIKQENIKSELEYKFNKYKLKPGKDIDVIIGAVGDQSLLVLDALHSLGLKIPEDITIAGLGHAMRMENIYPGISTISQCYYDLGINALENMMLLIKNKPIPEKIQVPGKLIIRNSCGCKYLQRIKKTNLINEKKFPAINNPETQIQKIRENILHNTNFAPVLLDKISNLLITFLEEIKEDIKPNFLKEFESALLTSIEHNIDLFKWFDIIKIFRRDILNNLDNREQINKGTNLIDNAIVLISEIDRDHKKIREYDLLNKIIINIRSVSIKISRLMNLDEILVEIHKGLMSFDFPSFYICFYKNLITYKFNDPPPDQAKILLAYNQYDSKLILKENKYFYTKNILPDNIWPKNRIFNFVILTLFFKQTQIGYMILEAGPKEHEIYSTFKHYFASAFYTALIWEKLQENSAEIIRKNYILDTFMDTVPDGIYFKDKNSKFIRTNQACYTEYGFNDPQEIVGKTDFDFFAEHIARQKFVSEQEIIKSGKPIINQVTKSIRGEWILTTKMPLRNEKNEIIGIFGISRNITELKITQQALEKANEEILRLNELLQKENVRMKTELDVARQMQDMIIPQQDELEKIQEIDIFGNVETAEEVGGDYYDVFTKNESIYIGVGDVAGHGLKSGIIMIMLQTAIRTLIEAGINNLLDIVSIINNVLYKNIRRMESSKMLTLVFLQYNDHKIKITGHHEDIIIIRQSNKQQEIMETHDLGVPLAVLPKIHKLVKEREISLEPGDGIVLFTDGITEARNSLKKLYGVKRLSTIVKNYWYKKPNEICNHVFTDLKNFVGDEKMHDDVALLIIKQK